MTETTEEKDLIAAIERCIEGDLGPAYDLSNGLHMSPGEAAAFHKSTEEIVYRYFRITKDNASKQNSWPNWLLEAWNRPTDELYFVGSLRNRGLPDYGKLHISTKDGDIPVEWDHYIAIKPCGEIFTTDKIPFNSKGEA